MKTTYLSTILFIGIPIALMAQNIQEEKVSFNDLRMPLHPLGENLAGYTFTVSTPYPENNDDIVAYAKEQYEMEVANYDQTVEESVANHEADMEEYEREVEIARENFKLESEEFKKMSFVERMAMADQKPQLKLPRKPIYRKPPIPRYREPNLSNAIVFNPEVLADSYLRLDGYKMTDKGENIVQGHVTLYDFEYMEPEQKVEEQSYYDVKAGKKKIKREYWYETSYKRPARLELAYNGKTLYSDLFEGTDTFVTEKTSNRPIKMNIEKGSIGTVLSKINEYINSNYGYSKVDRLANVYFVKNKKGQYNDLEEAKDFAIAGYQNFEFGKPNEDLNSAIVLWETALEASNLEDNKARIDKKVTTAILFNLIDATLHTNKFDQTGKYISKLKKLKLNSNEENVLEAKAFILKDKKMRNSKNNVVAR